MTNARILIQTQGSEAPVQVVNIQDIDFDDKRDAFALQVGREVVDALFAQSEVQA